MDACLRNVVNLKSGKVLPVNVYALPLLLLVHHPKSETKILVNAFAQEFKDAQNKKFGVIKYALAYVILRWLLVQHPISETKTIVHVFAQGFKNVQVQQFGVIKSVLAYVLLHFLHVQHLRSETKKLVNAFVQEFKDVHCYKFGTVLFAPADVDQISCKNAKDRAVFSMKTNADACADLIKSMRFFCRQDYLDYTQTSFIKLSYY